MSISSSQKHITWRHLLRIHGPGFLNWLQTSLCERKALGHIATQLADFLIDEIERLRTECPDAPLMFWKQIPMVHSCCSVPGIFENPFAVHAYAYVHLLERYRRTWAVLKYLSSVAVLPLGIHGVRTLDIGAGPAPSLFAIADFYQALNQYAREGNIPALQLPEPELHCIERSQPMVVFFHHSHNSVVVPVRSAQYSLTSRV